MRDSLIKHRRTLLFWLVLGLLLNIVVAYSSYLRGAALSFSWSDDGSYHAGDWTYWVEEEDGWSTDGTTFGMTGWIDAHYIYNPLNFYSDENGISDNSGTRQETRTSGIRIGWPFRCFQVSEIWIEQTTWGPKIENERRAYAVQETDLTPTPYWYSKGVQISLNSSSAFTIPVKVRPLQLLINTLFYSVVLYMGHHLFLFSRKARRKRRGLCADCGYAVEDLVACPECGMTCITQASLECAGSDE